MVSIQKQIDEIKEELNTIDSVIGKLIDRRFVPLDVIHTKHQKKKALETLQIRKSNLANCRCPYPGLKSFNEDDRLNFHGREEIRDYLIDRIDHRLFTILFGPLGYGKSSLINAGLLPILQDKQEDYFVFSFNLLYNLVSSIIAKYVKWLDLDLDQTGELKKISELSTLLRNGEINFNDICDQIISKNSKLKIICIFDQFEKIYKYDINSDEYKMVMKLISQIRNMPYIHIIIAIQGNFLDDRFIKEYQIQEEDKIKLNMLKSEELRKAIIKPAEDVDRTIPLELVDIIVNELNEEPSSLWLLQATMSQLWSEQTADRRMTYEAYIAIGGVTKSLIALTASVFKELHPEKRASMEHVLLQLVQPRDETSYESRIATKSEIGEENWDLIETLQSKGLVSCDYDEHQELTAVLVHELLVTNWEELTIYLQDKDNRDFRIWQEELRSDIRRWRINSHNSELLFATKLRIAEVWLLKRGKNISSCERNFIKKSIEHRKNQRRLKIGLILIITSIILFLILKDSVYAHMQQLSALGDVKMITVATIEIEQHEVSNRRYQFCVNAGVCLPPIPQISTFYDPTKTLLPVTGIDALQAATFCRWIGRRLPSHAEWVVIALPSSRWPPGEWEAMLNAANLDQEGNGIIQPIGISRSETPEHIYHLVGNVMEWTSTPVSRSGELLTTEWNGEAGTMPSYLTAVGGSFFTWSSDIRGIVDQTAKTKPNSFQASSRQDDIGFRCVRANN